ncbi:MAG: radical SAM protein [Rikenellaceae bacterium]
MKYLLVTPPFVQLNTPYPATTVLKAWLTARGDEVLQCDIGIEVAEKVFCREFLESIFERAFQKDRLSSRAKTVALARSEYLSTIDIVWNFLQGRDNTLVNRIAMRGFLPEGNQFRRVKDEDLEWAYGTSGLNDRAKYLSTLYIEDLAEFVSEILGCDFSLIRYEQRIAASSPVFDHIYNKLSLSQLNDLEKITIDIFNSKMQQFSPDIVGFTVPFPGTLLMALRMAQHVKMVNKKTCVVVGGGFVNTELRSMSDVRFFENIDFLLFDDGELPLESVGKFMRGEIEQKDIVRAKYIDALKVCNSERQSDVVAFDKLPTPDFSDLPMEKYVSLVEFSNPMHKLWSDGRWNKMTMAHGCYWAKCAFCDTSLDYIARYDAPEARTVVDRMKNIAAQTGVSGFHFTDEALPPKLLREVCEIIINEKLTFSFWGNIRFEKSYDATLCKLLHDAGCIAVSGGLEVVSERILKLINKGVTIDQTVKCCAAFNEAGIMVHTYLMYGFPSQTADEAVESLEIVRQMFEEGVVQSAFWHRYAMTVHSPSGCSPEKYCAKIVSPSVNPFANNSIEFTVDGDEADWVGIGKSMTAATQNYMQGKGYELPMRNWFGKDYQNPQISKSFVYDIIEQQ